MPALFSADEDRRRICLSSSSRDDGCDDDDGVGSTSADAGGASSIERRFANVAERIRNLEGEDDDNVNRWLVERGIDRFFFEAAIATASVVVLFQQQVDVDNAKLVADSRSSCRDPLTSMNAAVVLMVVLSFVSVEAGRCCLRRSCYRYRQREMSKQQQLLLLLN